MTFPGNWYTRSPSIPLALSERLRQEKGSFDSEASFLRGLGDRVQEVCELLSLESSCCDRLLHHINQIQSRCPLGQVGKIEGIPLDF
jgi:hypothetical protein